MKLVRVGLMEYKITGIPLITFGSKLSAKAYFYNLFTHLYNK